MISSRVKLQDPLPGTCSNCWERGTYSGSILQGLPPMCAQGDSVLPSLREAAPSSSRTPGPSSENCPVLERLPEPHLLPSMVQGPGLLPRMRVATPEAHGPCYLRIALLCCFTSAFLTSTSQTPAAPSSPSEPLPLEKPPWAGPRPHHALTSLCSACTASNKNTFCSYSASKPLLYSHRDYFQVLSQDVSA